MAIPTWTLSNGNIISSNGGATLSGNGSASAYTASGRDVGGFLKSVGGTLSCTSPLTGGGAIYTGFITHGNSVGAYSDMDFWMAADQSGNLYAGAFGSYGIQTSVAAGDVIALVMTPAMVTLKKNGVFVCNYSLPPQTSYDVVAGVQVSAIVNNLDFSPPAPLYPAGRVLLPLL